MAQVDSGLIEPEAPSVLAKEPETPDEYFEAVLLMVRVDRIDLARRYLRTFLDQEPDEATLMRLRDIHGSSTFLQLSNLEEMRPQSQELLRRLQAAAGRQLSDPSRLDDIIADLQGDDRQREQAIRDLKLIGPEAIPVLLDRLSGDGHTNTHELLVFTMVKFGAVAIEPLLGAIDAQDQQTRMIAIESLGWLGDEYVVPHLWYPALAADQPEIVHTTALQAISRIRYGAPEQTNLLDTSAAVDEVFDRAVQHFRGEFPWSPDLDGILTVWTWDTDEDRLVGVVTSPANASAFMAEKLARQAMLLMPESEASQALFLAATMAHERIRAGWNQPAPSGPGTAHDLALSSGPGLTEWALGMAVEHGNPAAALVALTALAEMASPDQLQKSAGMLPPIVAALDFPNDRVQFAAAMTVLNIEPIESFPRAHRVVEIFSQALIDDGAPHGVVIDPNVQRAVDTASMLGKLGFTASVAPTAREGFNQAVAHGDLSLIVLHPNTIRWELTQTVANFRSDSRTAGVPLVIAAPEPARFDMQRFLEQVPISGFVATGGDAAHWLRQIEPVLAQTNSPPLTSEQKRARMEAAASALRYLSRSPLASIFDLAPAEIPLAESINHPAAGPDVVLALAGIGRPSIQRRLLDVILSPVSNDELRQLVTRELLLHMERHGQLLSEHEVNIVHDVWNGETGATVESSPVDEPDASPTFTEEGVEALLSHPVPTLPLAE
ncbi:MAG: HEAT repeat domain-containing protein [Planctomycetaceae bacterium]|nr:HEAT repeat domain-containing protein [Planctomycetaceae bacterium]